MTADARLRLGGIPDFGAVAPRPRLVSLVATHSPGLTLVVAPSGTGKSVLAAQYLASRSPRHSAWLDCSRTGRDSESVLRTLLAELDPERDSRDEYGLGVSALRDDSEGLVLSIAKAVSRLDDPSEMVVVLDDFPDITCETAQHLTSLGQRMRGFGSRVIVTTRALSADSVPVLHEAQVIDDDDLRLTLPEAAEVASAITARTIEENHVVALREACSGHAATFAVLLRHAELGPEGWTAKATPSIDLQSRLHHHAVTSLSTTEQRALFVMALLGRGTTTDLQKCGVEAAFKTLAHVSHSVPLVRAADAQDGGVSDTFLMHDLAQEVFGSDAYVAILGDFAQQVWPVVVDVLVRRGDTLRAALIVEARSDGVDKAAWLLEHSDQVMRRGGSSCLLRMIQQLPVSVFIKSPGLLLVHARLLQERSEFEEAIEKANVARAIAEHERDELLVAESMLVAAGCYSDTGNYEAALDLLRDLAARPSSRLTHDQRAWALAAMAGCCMNLGRGPESLQYASEAACMARDQASSAGVRSYVLGMAGAIAALVRGDLAESLAHFNRASESEDVPRALQAKAQGNRAVSLCEMGRLERCIETVRLSLETCLEADQGLYRGAFLPVLGAAMVGLGSGEPALREMREGIQLSLGASDRYGASYSRIYLATALRATGRSEESLAEAEEALEYFSGIDAISLRELATLELGASLLSIGDTAAGTRTVETLRSRMSGLNSYHLLKADMILAESERRRGSLDKAIARLTTHEEYILSESSNWQIAMYCRAFPELLGVFALAIDIERLPAHLIRMILPETAEIVLAATKSMLEPALWEALGRRILGDEGFAEYLSRGGRPLCRVRLFGGLEVNVAGRIVSERDWRKRKARLLFAMLVLRRGQDVPRDQVLEHLWPEMDETRAKNNLYVIWSAMKNALSPEAGKNEPCPYIDSTGGVCRAVADSVRSDVEEFEQVLSKAREAQAAGKVSDALGFYERLAEIYRGELLPGDVYDDWFAQVRDEFRAKYADAMLQAASVLQAQGDPLGALTFVRRALNQDPWREDLYQAALRCQIAAGQRSAAIDTYLQCRSKLTEDLGLDPSGETRALYDQILAMEETPPPPTSFDSGL